MIWLFVWIALVLFFFFIIIVAIRSVFVSVHRLSDVTSELMDKIADVTENSKPDEEKIAKIVNEKTAIEKPFSLSLREHVLRKMRATEKMQVKQEKLNATYEHFRNYDINEYLKEYGQQSDAHKRM
jgi:anaerobic ribonucleoside-triphosphate reductase